MDSYQPAKRSRDDFEQDQGFSGGYQQPPRSNFASESKRQHIDPAAELIANICKDIRRIGENSNTVTQVDDISYISNPIVAEFEQIDKLRSAVLDTIYAVVIEQPQKISALCVLILLCNPKNFLVPKYVIEFLHSKAQGLIDALTKSADDLEENSLASKTPNPFKEQEKNEFAGSFNNLKSILKFLAALSPIIEGRGIVDIFKQFIQLAIDIQTESNTRNGLAEEIYYNTLIALPYLLSNDFSDTSKGYANEVVELAERFPFSDAESSQSFAIFEPFNKKDLSLEGQIPYHPQSIASLILPALKDLQTPEKSWANLKDKLFIDFQELIEPIIARSLENNPLGNEPTKHALPPLAFPSSASLLLDYNPNGIIDNVWYRYPRILFQVYNITTDFETVPPINSYTGIFFKDLAFDILNNMSFNKSEASIQLSILDLYFNKDLFSPPGSSIEQLSMIHKDNVSGENSPPLSTWKVEDVAVESILTMIFQLPLPLHVEVYYYSVLISCCKENPDSIAPVFGRAIRFFYNNLESLDYELKIRFLDWMSIQISNFEFSWKWDEWVKDSQRYRKLKYHPKRNFVKNLIAKEIRLSNKKRIRESFVTLDPESGSLVHLKEFYQYLDLSLVQNDPNFVLDYDSELFGNLDEIRNIFAKLLDEREEKRATSAVDVVTISPQDDLIYNFSFPSVPLFEIANSAYDFIVANYKSNNDFQDLCNGVLIAAEERLPEANKERLLVNLILQTYVFAGSRSIFSVVSLLSRDILKLRYLAGWNLSEEEYKDEQDKFRFAPSELTSEQFNQRQEWIVASILRIWNHQPQVAFLILEYLIDFKILIPIKLIERSFDKSSNFIIANVSCMESIDRVLQSASKKEKETKDNAEVAKVPVSGNGTDNTEEVGEKEVLEGGLEQTGDDGGSEKMEEEIPEKSESAEKNAEIVEEKAQVLLLRIFGLIVENLNSILGELGVPADAEVIITRNFGDEDIEDGHKMKEIDNQWLFYEYLGLLKSYLRKYSDALELTKDELKNSFNDLENIRVKDEVLTWIDELN